MSCASRLLRFQRACVKKTRIIMGDVVDAIIEDTNVSVKEAMKAFYNCEIFDRLCDPETGLYRESGGYVYDLYKIELGDSHQLYISI